MTSGEPPHPTRPSPPPDLSAPCLAPAMDQKPMQGQACDCGSCHGGKQRAEDRTRKDICGLHYILLPVQVFLEGRGALKTKSTYSCIASSQYFGVGRVSMSQCLLLTQARLLEVIAAANGRKLPYLPPSIHSNGGIRAVIQNDAIVGRIARPLKEDEQEFGLRVIPIFLQPRVFFAHPSAKVKSLTADQLIGIFSGAIKNWSEVGGPDLRVRVVRREEADSSLAVFRNTLPGWKELQFDKHRSKLAVSTQDAFETVKQHEGAIGFGPYNSKLDERLTVLSVNGISPIGSELSQRHCAFVDLSGRDRHLSSARLHRFCFHGEGAKRRA